MKNKNKKEDFISLEKCRKFAKIIFLNAERLV